MRTHLLTCFYKKKYINANIIRAKIIHDSNMTIKVTKGHFTLIITILKNKVKGHKMFFLVYEYYLFHVITDRRNDNAETEK